MTKENTKIILDGCKVLKDKHFYKEVFAELNSLKSSDSFNELKREEKQNVVRLLAECTYQDKEINSKVRFKEALKLLEELDKFDKPSDKPETLCLIGAVYKRKYQISKNLDDLFASITHYKAASDDVENDDGYGAVNAIYLYKTLIKEHHNTLETDTIDNYESTINSIRKKALEHLLNKYDGKEDKPVWIDRTVCELYFSQDNYEEAKKHLKKSETDEELKKLEDLSEENINDDTKKAIKRALKIEISESRDKLIFIEQIIRLYKVQSDDIGKTKIEFLEKFFNGFIDERKVQNIIHNVLVGKLGLALSGGGFRASLFHIGVFARLAELDMLRHVDVISSVSGGSIIAMHYYIKLKQLLETTDNYKIVQKDYIDLVKEMQEEFLDGVQTNIRMQALEQFNPCNETVTERLGKLYQEVLFSKAIEGVTPQKMSDLYINPLIDGSKEEHFNPHFNNLELKNKVPILVINSTCINNGHNWRFTASGMGESQYMYDTTIDKNSTHKYARYTDFKNGFENFTIANAVAASSCVPGLFDPIELNGAYRDAENIKLVDGGVYDNQGLASILDEECNLVLCSDASGQFNDDDNPSSCRLSISPKITNALMDRGRDAEYQIIKEMLNDKKIDGLCILHLKQCFKTKEYTPNNPKPDVQSSDSRCKECDIYDEYGEDIQDALSKIRTDLDSFNDVEAYTLMYSGYTIMSKWFEAIKEEQPVWKSYEAKDDDWKFFKIKDVIKNDKTRLLERLKDSKDLFFKIKPWKASDKCKYTFIAGAVLLVIILICFLSLIGLAVVLMLGLYVAKKDKLLYKIVKYTTKPLFWVIAKFNLKCLNEKYLESGKIKDKK